MWALSRSLGLYQNGGGPFSRRVRKGEMMFLAGERKERKRERGGKRERRKGRKEGKERERKGGNKRNSDR